MQSATTIQQSESRSFGQALRAFFSYQSSRKIKAQEMMLFCRQLASFVRVGVPVTTALETFAEQATKERLRKIYQAVAADLQRGVRLSNAMAAHPEVFPRLVSDMVRSAEVTGNLDVVLRQAARHIEREAAARQKIKAAMTYPAVIASFAILLTIGIVVFVLPKFNDLYASLGVPVPGILRGLLAFSHFVSTNALAIAAVILGCVVLLGTWIRSDRGRYTVDSALLRVPVIAALVRASMTERFCRTLGDMLAAGVPISQTFAVVITNVRNRVFRQALEKVGPAVAAGRGMYGPLQETGIFAPAVVQMFRVGEQTGHLDTNLAEAADMYEQELDYRLKRLTSLLEPAMIVFVGLMVGFIAVTLITSIYSLAGSYK